jgi:hypothetical protein
MVPNNDFVSNWEQIIASVTKTEVPLECIKKVVIKLKGGRQKTVNISKLQEQGISIDSVELMLTQIIEDLDEQIRDIDFVVDVKAVAELVQPETDKLLNGLK